MRHVRLFGKCWPPAPDFYLPVLHDFRHGLEFREAGDFQVGMLGYVIVERLAEALEDVFMLLVIQPATIRQDV